jgi:glycosyltransferase involved in cell wall biosynthesis
MSGSPQHVCVIIPARNEEELLPRCLQSVRAALLSLPDEATSDLVVAVDRSTDRTLQIARREVGRQGKVVCTDAGVVGEARAAATEAALRRYRGLLERCWLANTDADCEVPANWLIDQLMLAANGVDAVAGTIEVDNFEGHLPIVKQRFRETYLIRADGSHHHVHGANLGMRADHYRRAGGWRCLVTCEDHDLWNRLARTGARKMSTSRIEVLTSGRRVGRAPHGFAEALAAHNEIVA